VTEYLTPLKCIEAAGAVCSIIYSVLLIREKILGWVFGIVSSILGVILFFETKLYAQAIISIYYAGVGVYGWYYWVKAKQRDEHIHIWSIRQHLIYIAVFTVISIGCAYLFETYTDSSSPYLDSFITVFGLLASLKEARKILTSWVYWFILNMLSVWLYFSQHLEVYAVLMIVYAGICIPGYLNWKRIYNENKPESTSP